MLEALLVFKRLDIFKTLGVISKEKGFALVDSIGTLKYLRYIAK